MFHSQRAPLLNHILFFELPATKTIPNWHRSEVTLSLLLKSYSDVWLPCSNITNWDWWPEKAHPAGTKANCEEARTAQRTPSPQLTVTKTWGKQGAHRLNEGTERVELHPKGSIADTLPTQARAHEAMGQRCTQKKWGGFCS